MRLAMRDRPKGALGLTQQNQPLAFTRYCYCQSCMVYGLNREGRGGGRILRKTSRNSIAAVCVMQMGGGDKGMLDSCIHKNK